MQNIQKTLLSLFLFVGLLKASVSVHDIEHANEKKLTSNAACRKGLADLNTQSKSLRTTFVDFTLNAVLGEPQDSAEEELKYLSSQDDQGIFEELVRRARAFSKDNKNYSVVFPLACKKDSFMYVDLSKGYNIHDLWILHVGVGRAVIRKEFRASEITAQDIKENLWSLFSAVLYESAYIDRYTNLLLLPAIRDGLINGSNLHNTLNSLKNIRYRKEDEFYFISKSELLYYEGALSFLSYCFNSFFSMFQQIYKGKID